MRLVLGLWMLLSVQPVSTPITGAWNVENYVLQDGTEHSVAGLIFFTEKDWSVVFLIRGDDGEPRRGSGEAGSYTLEGKRLTFSHLFHLSAGAAVGSLPEAPLRLRAREPADAVTEACEVDIDGDAMTIYFPSGNRMTFSRSSGF